METFSNTQASATIEADFAVTIAIPARNAQAHIRRAIDSALRQTFPAVEVIVVDDASTDATATIVRDFGDPRIRLLRRETPGAGGYAARNLAIEEAVGSWMAFLDADDEWEDSHLEHLLRLHLQFPQAEMLSTSWRVVGAKRQTTGNHYLRKYSREGSHELDLHRFLSRWARGRAPIWTSAACVRREPLQAAGGFPEGRCTRGGDVDTWLRVMLAGGTQAYSTQVTAVYHRDVESSVTRSRIPQVDHCTGATVHHAIRERKNLVTRWLLKRLGNAHRKDPLRKKARGGSLRPRDLSGFYPMASPLFFALMLFLALTPHRVVRSILTLRDRAVSMRSTS